ncbi:hypothetical protein VB618_01720 [Microvirga sp. CF3062]|uniref:hypothetical protein n=1 Tax=Microvirga sp. CF3062 TaxID=3110182 RepID=UPI002E79F669|nr:hypothetical protein [Microvirga sp. CF3062]MEE1654899.1 hypothetical protein [Microvirga sp. CF3062]
MKAAAFGLGVILLVLPFAARSDENLVAKREACRQEARLAIAPKGKIGVDSFRRIVERRVSHVSQCMDRAFVARKDAPLPPRRALGNALDRDQAPATGSVRSASANPTESAGLRKLKSASTGIFKVKKPGHKQLRRSFRRSK